MRTVFSNTRYLALGIGLAAVNACAVAAGDGSAASATQAVTVPQSGGLLSTLGSPPNGTTPAVLAQLLTGQTQGQVGGYTSTSYCLGAVTSSGPQGATVVYSEGCAIGSASSSWYQDPSTSFIHYAAAPEYCLSDYPLVGGMTLMACNTANPSYQQWALDPQTGLLRNTAFNDCMAFGSQWRSYTTTSRVTCNASSYSQLFAPFETLLQGELVVDGMCLDVPGTPGNGTHLETYTCHEGSNQQWVFNANGSISPVQFPSLCIDIPAGWSGIQPLQLYTCSKDATDGQASMNQRWVFDELGQIHSALFTSECIDLPAGSQVVKTQLTTYQCNNGNSPNQVFTVQ